MAISFTFESDDPVQIAALDAATNAYNQQMARQAARMANDTYTPISANDFLTNVINQTLAQAASKFPDAILEATAPTEYAALVAARDSALAKQASTVATYKAAKVQVIG